MINKSAILTILIFFGAWSQGHAESLSDFEQEGLVSVSSELEDIGTGALSRVYGIGSILVTDAKSGMDQGTLEKDLRYFVLTAGHVSMGHNLMVKFGNGTTLPIRQSYHLASQDISLLEIDLKRYARKIFPFAHFVKVRKGGFSFGTANLLIAHLQLANLSALPDESQNLVEDIYTRALYMMTSSEGLDGVIMSRGALSGVVTPTWINLSKMVQKEIDPSSTLSRDLFRNENQIIPVRFQAGMSGSPVIVGWRTQSGYQHNLAGLLTLVKENGVTTESSSAKKANQLIDSVLTGSRGPQEPTSWFLFKNHFVRQQKLELEFFINSGPIGNGVVIDGLVSPEKSDSQFEHELSKENMTRSQIVKLRQNLQKLSPPDLKVIAPKGRNSILNSQLTIKIR